MRDMPRTSRIFPRVFSRAFSFVEVLIVITVICILAAVLIKVPPSSSGMSVSVPTANGKVTISEGDFVKVDATDNLNSSVKPGIYYVVVRQEKNGFGRELGLMSSTSTDFTLWLSPEVYRSKEAFCAFTVIKRSTDEHRKTMEKFRPEYSSTPSR